MSRRLHAIHAGLSQLAGSIGNEKWALTPRKTIGTPIWTLRESQTVHSHTPGHTDHQGQDSFLVSLQNPSERRCPPPPQRNKQKNKDTHTHRFFAIPLRGWSSKLRLGSMTIRSAGEMCSVSAGSRTWSFPTYRTSKFSPQLCPLVSEKMSSPARLLAPSTEVN